MASFQDKLKRIRQGTEESFNKKFRSNQNSRQSNLQILQQLNNNKAASTRSPATLLRQLQASSKYEAWFNSNLEEDGRNNDEGSRDPYHQNNFTIGTQKKNKRFLSSKALL